MFKHNKSRSGTISRRKVSMKPFALLFAATIFASTICLGGTKVWTGATSNSWSISPNWSPPAVPVAIDSVIIPVGSTSPNVDSTRSCAYLRVLSGERLNFNTAGVTLTVNGNVDFFGGSNVAITADATLDIKGDIRVDGTWPFTNPPSRGTVRFSGTGDQVVSGSSMLGIKNLEAASGGTLVFFTNVVVDTLKLLGGQILLLDNGLNLGLLKVYGNIVGAGTTRYLITSGTGGLIRAGVGNITAVSFPIGTSSTYNPVTLRTGTGIDDFTARVIGSLSPTSLNSASAVQRTWVITEGTVGGNGSMTATFGWNSSDEGANITAANRSTLGSWRHNGTAWAPEGTAAVSGSGPFVATITGLTPSGNHTLGLPGFVTSVEDGSSLPTEFALSQNYPNPFNPNTTIKYDLAKESQVSIRLFNVLGQEVATLVNEEQKAGFRSVEWNAANLTSGVYYYRLEAGEFVQTRKLMLLK